MLPSLAKVHALHGELDLTELYSLPEKFKNYIPKRGSAAARHNLVRSIGMVELSDLGQFTARGDDEYQRIVAQLMDKLVKPTAPIREKETTSSRLHEGTK
jgi:hypothetical protein